MISLIDPIQRKQRRKTTNLIQSDRFQFKTTVVNGSQIVGRFVFFRFVQTHRKSFCMRVSALTYNLSNSHVLGYLMPTKSLTNKYKSRKTKKQLKLCVRNMTQRSNLIQYVFVSPFVHCILWIGSRYRRNTIEKKIIQNLVLLTSTNHLSCKLCYATPFFSAALALLSTAADSVRSWAATHFCVTKIYKIFTVNVAKIFEYRNATEGKKKCSNLIFLESLNFICRFFVSAVRLNVDEVQYAVLH